MFVAYAVPKDDFHLVVEDGLHFVVVGATKDEALANLRARFAKEQEEDNKRSVELGYEPDEPYELEESYVAHVQEA